MSGAGKSTLANAVEARLHGLNYLTFLLDGDNVRHGLCRDLGFSDADRTENIRRVTEVAKFFLEGGIITLAAFISPKAEDRERCRAMFAPGEFLEIFCQCPLEICESRDVKGLYKKARAGEMSNFTGISSTYDVPLTPDLTVPTSVLDLAASVDLVMELLYKRGAITRRPELATV